MKLLVLAQTPPPIHGQSVMVRTLVNGLPRGGIAVHHVNLLLSRDSVDIGQWRIGKIFATLWACVRAVVARFTRGCDTLYYVPAPAKRGALYRDWAVMFLCRIFFRHTVLHWHAVGLGEWLRTEAKPLERIISRALLGRVSLAIVLSESLREDAAFLKPRRIGVVPNGVEMTPLASAPIKPATPTKILFLGLCSEEKGLFAAARAVSSANHETSAPADAPNFILTAAGAFPDFATERRFLEITKENPRSHLHAGLVQGAAKEKLFAESHALCLPTRYASEGQPLVLLEAMSRDLPVIATRWRGIADSLPSAAQLIGPGDDAALTQALISLRTDPPKRGIFRAHYEAHFTIEKHLQKLATVLSDMVR